MLITGLKHEASGAAVSEVSVAEVDVDDARRVSVARTQTRERARETSMEGQP